VLTVHLIDYYTVFDFIKKIEYMSKKALIGEGFSCIPPKEYAERLMSFLKNSLFKVENS